MYFYKCKECENIVFSKVEKELTCCNNTMEEILPNQVLEGEELEDIHYLKVRKIGALYTLMCEADHPMLEVHRLEFAILETKNSFYCRFLKPNDYPSIDFLIGPDEEYQNAYVYCNSFGLIEAQAFEEKELQDNSKEK